MPSRRTNYLPLCLLRLLSTGSHSCTVAMRRLRHALLSALRSLLHRTQHIRGLCAALIQRLRSEKRPIGHTSSALAYAAEIEQLFGTIFEHDALLELARGLRRQYLEALGDNPACMLPSYNHVLPTGEEEGMYVALDVGGSTFRVAVVELHGRGHVGGGSNGSEFKALKTYKIDDSVKQLAGEKFFEWLAERIEETLKGVQGLKIRENAQNDRVNMGLSWSFPIEHTSLRSGRIQAMGKGFRAMEGLLGADLADVLQGACDRRVCVHSLPQCAIYADIDELKGLRLNLTATVNDAAATLLCGAYITPHTHYGLVLGTGVNVAVHLPVSLLAPKLASRAAPPPLTDHSHVIVNSEISMFGASLLPLTRFDEALDVAHPMPGFQPLELMVSGRYLGEIVRLIILEGVTSAGLLGGEVPRALEVPYGLDTRVVAGWAGEGTEAGGFLEGMAREDAEALRRIAAAVARRASALVAAAIFALRGVRDGGEGADALPGAEAKAEAEANGRLEKAVGGTVVACAGSVIEHYPGFMAGCQGVLDRMAGLEGERGREVGRVELCVAGESSLLGAAVGAAVAAGGGG